MAVWPTNHLLAYIRQISEQISEIRRIEHLLWEHKHRLKNLNQMPSTPQEMESDWCDAVAYLGLKVLEGVEVQLTQLEPESYFLLEEVWLNRIKQLKAYYFWKNEDKGSPEANYSSASDSIRDRLLFAPRAELCAFAPIEAYIAKRYLRDDDCSKLDDKKASTNLMVAHKAQRIFATTHEPKDEVNWFRARLYISMFYENIIGAVKDNNREKTVAILKAFEFGKAADHRYLIINAFEAAIAVHFLNKEIVHQVLQDPQLYDFSMEPVIDWPTRTILPKAMRYDQCNRELIYEGVMTDAIKSDLLRQLTEERHRSATERLFQQSQLRPFEKQVL